MSVKVKLITDGCYDTPGIVGAIVEATPLSSGSYAIKPTELLKHDDLWQEYVDSYSDISVVFLADEVEEVE